MTAIYPLLLGTLAFTSAPAVVAAVTADEVRGVQQKTLRVNSRGGTQQLLVSRPNGTAAPAAAILVLPWMDCDSLVLPAEKLHGFQLLMRHLVERSGLVVGRVQKPGVGGSSGVCRDTDFDTELAAYRASFETLVADPWVNGRVVILGQSFSGGVVPLVAGPDRAAGYIVVNSWVRTWLERLLEFERNLMIQEKADARTLAVRMRAFSELYGAYLNERITPAEVIARRPQLTAVWKGEGTHQYDRPAAFFHQLQALNLEEEWSRVTRPTLILWGEADIVMHRADHERIAALVNHARPGAATLLTVPRAGHTLTVEGRVPDGVFATLEQWLTGVTRQ
jgi:pimeloyl-ACP methyl ester carboxylesterase